MDMFDGLIAEVRRAKPRKRMEEYDDYLQRLIKQTWGCEIYHYLDGWGVYATRQQRGLCDHTKKYITVPMWAIKKGIGKCTQYLAHEIAHVVVGPNKGHGPEFMEAFKNVCPRHLWHYETEHKPREARRAGIASLASMKVLEIFENN